MIVDVHTHIYEAGRGGPFGLPAGADDLVREMDAAGVEASVVIPLPGVASNEFVQRECARHRKRLVAMYTPEFGQGADVVSRMEGFLSNHRVAAVKVHPRLQGVTVADAVVRDVVAAAASRGLPVVFDVFPHGDAVDDERMWPMAYHGLARAHPDATFVLAHAGGFKAMDAFMVAKCNVNVLLDISFTLLYLRDSSVATDVGFLCWRLAAGKLLYGSDFPAVRFDEYLAAARRATEPLSAEARDALFGGAAVSRYRLRELLDA